MASSPGRKPAQPEPFVGIDEIVSQFGLRKSWVYKRTQTRTIPFYKVGRYCYFRPSEIEAYLQQRRFEPEHG